MQFCIFWQMCEVVYSPLRLDTIPFCYSPKFVSISLLLSYHCCVSDPIVLHFLECYISRIIQNAAFWNWLLSLSITHLRLIHVVDRYIDVSAMAAFKCHLVNGFNSVLPFLLPTQLCPIFCFSNHIQIFTTWFHLCVHVLHSPILFTITLTVLMVSGTSHFPTSMLLYICLF